MGSGSAVSKQLIGNAERLEKNRRIIRAMRQDDMELAAIKVETYANS